MGQWSSGERVFRCLGNLAYALAATSRNLDANARVRIPRAHSQLCIDRVCRERMSEEASSPLLLAAQALPYADEPVEGEDELEEKAEEAEAAEHRQRECEQEQQQPRKQSLGQRRNVELPELYVVNELPEEMETMRERDIQHFGPGLRRNSISLPQGINSLDLEALRLRHQMQAQEALNEESQAESVSSRRMKEKERGGRVGSGRDE